MTVDEEMFIIVMSSLGNSGSTDRIHYLVAVDTTLAGNGWTDSIFFPDPRDNSLFKDL